MYLLVLSIGITKWNYEFNDIYLNPLLDKISKENKSIFLLGDFNVDLLKDDHHLATNEFLDSLSSHMLLPHIIQPTRVTCNSKTLIDNIYSNILGSDPVSRNLTTTISDHLPPFVIGSNIFCNSPLGRKSNIYERDWPNFDQENFIIDYLTEQWNSINKKKQASVNFSFQSFLSKINFILDKHAPLKKVSKH